MKKTLALIGGGRISSNFIARLPRLSHDLGPVAAQSYRLASRIVNALGAGYPVKGYEDLQKCSAILICVPPAAIAKTVSECARQINWRCKTVLLCDTGLSSAEIAELRARGAHVGSLNSIAGYDTFRFVVEGDRTAVRLGKRLAREMKSKTVQIDSAKIGLYFAALSFTSGLFTPLIEAAVQCLRDSGVNADPAKLAIALFQNTLTRYSRAGKKSWTGPLATNNRLAVQREIQALSESRPLLARYYRETGRFALELFRRHVELLKPASEH